MGDISETSTFDATTALTEWGLALSTVKVDGGKQGASSLTTALNACNDSSIDVEQRLKITNAIKSWCSMADTSVSQKPMTDNISLCGSIIESIMLQPDDDPAQKAAEQAAAEAEAEAKKRAEEEAAAAAAGKKPPKVKAAKKREKKIEYGKCGLQEIATDLAKTMNTFSSKCPEYGEDVWSEVLRVLGNVSKVEYMKKKPLLKDCPAVSRYETIHGLFRTGPAMTGASAKVPPNILTVAQLYLNGEFSTPASQLVSSAERNQPGYFSDKMDILFDLMRTNDKLDAMSILNTTVKKNYESVRIHFENNIDVLLQLEFSRTSNLFNVMASNGSGKALSPFVPKFIAMLEDGQIKHGMSSMVFLILASISNADPDAIYPLIDKIYNLALSIPNTGNSLTGILSNCGKTTIDNDKKQATIKVTEMICSMLYRDEFGEQAVPMILNSIVNQFDVLGEENQHVLSNHIEKIKSHSGKSGIIVEKIVDWYEGRSLKKTDERLDALEAKVAAMNEDFAATCHNMEEVSALMDKKIADLKDFVGEVVKKLPQPCQLEVVGGMRKTLVLHFRCARSGQTVTTETKDWDQWCKVGFGLIKLGKCAAVAAAGNPMALAGGVGAIQDIYNGYKAKDDKDFNTFISQPFLTSAESDKLINQLRAGKFFEKMEYDAQTADWVCIGTLSQEEAEKRSANKQAIQDTKSNVTKTKGKNFGLGTMDTGGIAELMTAGSGVSTGVEVPKEATELMATATAVSTGMGGPQAVVSNVITAGTTASAAMNTSKPSHVNDNSSSTTTMSASPVTKPLPVNDNNTSTTTAAAAGPMFQPPIKKEKRRGSMFGSLFGSSSSSSNNAAEDAMAKAAEEAWVVRATQDSARIKALEERVAVLEKERSKVETLEAQVKQLMSVQGMK